MTAYESLTVACRERATLRAQLVRVSLFVWLDRNVPLLGAG